MQIWSAFGGGQRKSEQGVSLTETTAPWEARSVYLHLMQESWGKPVKSHVSDANTVIEGKAARLLANVPARSLVSTFLFRAPIDSTGGLVEEPKSPEEKLQGVRGAW